MRIDFSEPECSTCFHHRTSAIINTQESEPSNAIGYVSADVVPTTTSSPLHRSAPIRGVGTMTPLAPPVSSEPAQSLGSTIVTDGGLVGAFESMQAPVEVSSGSGASTTTTSSNSLPSKCSSPTTFGFSPVVTSVSSGPAQASSGVFGAPRTVTFGSMQASMFGSGVSATSTSSTPCPFRYGSMQAPVQASASSSWPAQAFGKTASACAPGYFNSNGATTSPSAATSLPGLSASSTSSPPCPAPVQASTSSSTSFSFRPAQDFGKTASASLYGNGGNFARPDIGFLPATNTSTTTVVFGTTPVSVSSLSGPTSSTTPKNPFSSSFPGFGVSYLPGSSSNLFGTMPPFGSVSADLKTSSTTAGGSVSGCVKESSSSILFGPNPLTKTPLFGDSSVSAGIKTSSLQPLGLNAAATLFPSTSFTPDAKFSTNPTIGHPLFASHEWSRRTGSRYPPYAPTPDAPLFEGNGNMKLVSISASESYQHKSHDELRWEDYKKGDKGSRPTAFFPTSNGFGIRIIPDHPQRPPSGFVPVVAGGTSSSSSRFGQTDSAFTGFGTMFPSSSSTSSTSFAAPTCPNFQRPHETAAFSSSASGCTACGATASSSAPGYFNFNGATTPPSAATSLPGISFSTSGSFPMMFGTTPAVQATTFPAVQAITPTLQAYPVMFGTNLVAQGTNIAVQATTPALQAYPMMFGTTPAAQGTAIPAVQATTIPAVQATTTPTLQAYPMMFGTNLVAQGTNIAVQATTPALQAYPMMFGTTPAAQGTTIPAVQATTIPPVQAITPTLQVYPVMFGRNLVAQGTNIAVQATTPALQAYPMMFGTTPAAQGTTVQATTVPGVQAITPTLQAYPFMFGTNLVAQGTNIVAQATTPALQAYPVPRYILLPFASMTLQ